jgi:integrase
MAKVFQKCKEDEKDRYYPCEKTRCGHKWTVRYRTPGGRSGRQLEESFDRKGDADDFAVKVENDKRAGIYIDPKAGNIPLRAYVLNDWLPRQAVAPRTWSNYSSLINLYLLPRLGDKPLSRVTKADIEHFKAEISQSLAPSTVFDRMKLVKLIFWSALQEKRIQDDPCKDVKNAPGSFAVDEDEIPSLEEVQLIAKHIAPHYRLSVWLMAGAGLRISETLAFNTECPRGDFMRIRWQTNARANREDCTTRLVPLKHRAEGEYRDVPMPHFLSVGFEAHIKEYGSDRIVFEDGAGRTREVDVLFAPRERAKGTMPTATTYGYHFRRAQIRAGLVTVDGKPKYTPHGLRHFFASTALARGIPIHEVSRWLGHRKINTTVDIYGHLLPEAWDRCREVIEDAMGSAYAVAA